jgi:hypothetical protein
MGPVTKAISQAYSDAVHGAGKRSAEWLEYVN